MRQFVVGDKVRRKKEWMDYWWEKFCNRHGYSTDHAFTVVDITYTYSIKVAELPDYFLVEFMELVPKKCISL